ncbi:subtilisin-like protease SBT4.2 [Rutidosis leptorrhynchoides]|uniref:subtilisin-like protease SBT4.2 n=1 Tax=Rutidosis leptorrhynchoides TaxID=125765 RepID=UPI003A9A2DF6
MASHSTSSLHKSYRYDVFLCFKADIYRLHGAYMGYLLEGEYNPALHHAQILKETVEPRFASTLLIRSCKRSFNGFFAKLTTEEKDKLAATSKRIFSNSRIETWMQIQVLGCR